MDRQFLDRRYSTRLTFDNEEGWAAVELHVADTHGGARVARVVYWDAIGQHVLEATGDELPLEIVEELFREARDRIRYGDVRFCKFGPLQSCNCALPCVNSIRLRVRAALLAAWRRAAGGAWFGGGSGRG
jgi:hypothetical protein